MAEQLSKTFVLNKLRLLPKDRELQVSDTRAKLRCPVHKGGNESTPSFYVNLERHIGSSRCFGCGIKGRNLRETLHFFSADYDGKELSEEELESLHDIDTTRFKDMVPDEDEEDDLEYEMPLPWRGDWRGISEDLLLELGCFEALYKPKSSKKDFVRTERMLVIPVKQLKQDAGEIYARIKRKKGQMGYFNAKRLKTVHTLFPFDHVKKMKSNVLVLVEGPRDALRFIQYGIPTLALLGAANFGQSKVELIDYLNPKYIFTALDGDEAGLTATAKIFEALKYTYDIKKIPMKDGEDPGNMEEDRILKIAKKLKALT